MSLWNLIGLTITLLAFAFVMLKINRISTVKRERTQDLFACKSISDDGIIELPDGIFRSVLEIEPLNMYLKTIEEQKILWLRFREMLNALHIPISIVIQSRHKDIKPYVDAIRDTITSLSSPQLAGYGSRLANYLEAEIAENRVKDHRYYIILEVNPHEQASDLQLPSETLQEFTTGFLKNLSPREAFDLAAQELQDAANVVASYCRQMGLGVYKLDKHNVLEMNYSAINRDLAPVASYRQIPLSQNIQTKSLTLEAIEKDGAFQEEETV